MLSNLHSKPVLLSKLKSHFQFEAVFDKLSVKIEEILANNCCGLVVSLAKGAAKHNSRQQKLIEVDFHRF